MNVYLNSNNHKSKQQNDKSNLMNMELTNLEIMKNKHHIHITKHATYV